MPKKVNVLIAVNCSYLASSFAENSPSITPIKLNPRFNITFPTESIYFPDLNNVMVSMLNVENVLNPPNNPVVRKSLVFFDIFTDCCSKPIINPINNPARTLDNNVPNGNKEKHPVHFENTYRKQDPRNPPIPTTSNSAILPPLFNWKLLLVEVIGLKSGSALHAQGELHSRYYSCKNSTVIK